MSELDNRPTPQPDPTSSAEFRVKLGTVGEINLKASFAGEQAKDLLPVIGVATGVAGPGILFLIGHLAGIPWGVPLMLTLILWCGIAWLLRKRTRSD